ncbi:MAG: hypothetical protein E7643_01500 [Ruminococcaceae bacterium]|nr:hypothetical protein [Oscillospiraceae bacterium]
MIEKRRVRWEERHDLSYDRRLCAAAVECIMSDAGMRREILERPYLLIEAVFLIVDKKKATVPFFFNEVQRDFISRFERLGTGRPYYILKGRQQGFTSLITAMQLSFAIVRKNFSGMTLADTSDNALAIFNDRARAVYDRLPKALLPTERFSSKKEFYFDVLNSSWRVSTATGNAGRSRTLNFVHFSEVAFYDCPLAELQKGIGEALTEDAICIYETTANGLGESEELWRSGACHNLFYEWWRTSEYRCRDLSYLETRDPWLLSRIALLRSRGLEEEQIAWYCRKYASYLDKSTIRQEYPCTPEEAFVSGGECVFDKERLTAALMQRDRTPVPRRGYFTYRRRCKDLLGTDGEVIDTELSIEDIAFCESPAGYILLYEEPRVRRNGAGAITERAPYSLGGDTAGEGSDCFTGKVICDLDGRSVATLHIRHIDEDLYAEQMYCLGKYYNDAMIGIEINYSAYPMRLLERTYRYPRLYYRERNDREGGGVKRSAGFETTQRTKPLIIANLVSVMREGEIPECDAETLREMLTFTRLSSGGMGAVTGKHDDLVMALAIAHYIAASSHRTWERETEEGDDFIQTYFHRETASENASYMNWEGDE